MLEEMTFHDFVEEVNLGRQVKGLVITIEGPGLKAVEQILRDDEKGFEAMRHRFKKAIRNQRSNRIPSESSPLAYDIEIEAMSGDGTQSSEVDDDDDDFMI
jgi:hypothetical protein